jgi:hypothetical protein
MARGGEAAIISKSSITALSDFALLTKTAWHEIKAGASEVAGALIHGLTGLGEHVKTQRELNAEAAREATIRRETADVMKARQVALDKEVKTQKELAEFAEKAAKIGERVAGIREKVAEEMGGKRGEAEKERDWLIKEFAGPGRTPAELGEAYRAMFPQGPLAAELEAIKGAKEEAAKLQAKLEAPENITKYLPKERKGLEALKFDWDAHKKLMAETTREMLERERMTERLADLQPLLEPEREEIAIEETRVAIIAELTNQTEAAVRSQREFKASQDAAKASAKELADAQREVASALSLTFTAEEKYAKAMGDLDKWDKLGALGAGAAGSRNRARLEAEAKQELLDAWKRESSQSRMPDTAIRGTQEEHAAIARFTNDLKQRGDVEARFNDFVQTRLNDVASDLRELVRIGNETNKFEAPP